MLLFPLSTPLLQPGDDLADVILLARRSPPKADEGGSGVKDDAIGGLLPGDILVLSSKALATVEGAMIDLRTVQTSQAAHDLSRRTGRSPAFCEAMLNELRRLNGKVIGAVPGAAMTDVRPEGLTHGSILIANAGLDESNAPEGSAIGWPGSPVESVGRLKKELEKRLFVTRYSLLDKQKNRLTKNEKRRTAQPRLAIILSDSNCVPRRNGVSAIALTVSGLDPLQSQKGKRDLFGKPLQITTEAIADQLATAGNFVMGNAAQSIPAVIVRDHGLTLSEWEGWVLGIEPDEDIFRAII